jgi:F-type H+-transporting ATPase subunit delta
MATADRVSSYAQAMFEVARAEGNLDEVEDELFRFARVLEGSDELRERLTDPTIPASRRQQIVEELLGGRASDTTTALVSMVVGTGRARDLTRIVSSLVEMSARENRKAVAEVRSAVPLSDDQLSRLTTALNQATGKSLEVKVIVDPTVMGGLLTQIGDTVIDGTVRAKLAKLREILT